MVCENVANLWITEVTIDHEPNILAVLLLTSCPKKQFIARGGPQCVGQAILVIFYSGRDVGNLVAITLLALDTSHRTEESWHLNTSSQVVSTSNLAQATMKTQLTITFHHMFLRITFNFFQKSFHFCEQYLSPIRFNVCLRILTCEFLPKNIYRHNAF